MERFLYPLLLSVASWLIPWFIMWAMHSAAAKDSFYVQEIVPQLGDIITEDGNDLFKTGVSYTFILFWAIVCPWKWLCWILFAATVFSCIPPIGGLIKQTIHPAWKLYFTFSMKASRFLCVLCPLLTSAVILIFECL